MRSLALRCAENAAKVVLDFSVAVVVRVFVVEAILSSTGGGLGLIMRGRRIVLYLCYLSD